MPPYRWGRGGEVPRALQAPPDVVGCFSELGLGYGPWPPRCPCSITWAAALLGGPLRLSGELTAHEARCQDHPRQEWCK